MEIYSDFQAQAEHRKSFSHFAKLRPTQIRLMSTANLRQCLCEYCTNVELKLLAVNALAAKLKNECRIRHGYHAVDIITCGRIYKNVCLSRQISRTGFRLRGKTTTRARHGSLQCQECWECSLAAVTTISRSSYIPVMRVISQPVTTLQ